MDRPTRLVLTGSAWFGFNSGFCERRPNATREFSGEVRHETCAREVMFRARIRKTRVGQSKLARNLPSAGHQGRLPQRPYTDTSASDRISRTNSD